MRHRIRSVPLMAALAAPLLGACSEAGPDARTTSGLVDPATPPAPSAAVVPSPSPPRILFHTGRDGNREVYVMEADGSGQTNLSDHPANDGSPDWSPDRTRVAFHSTRSQTAAFVVDIWATDSDGSDPVNLTDAPGADASPAWSPDGTRIAFHSFRSGGGDIYVMNADGTGQTRLTLDPTFECCSDWSPDGTRIVFERGATSSTTDVWVMNADGSGQTNLTAAFPGRDARPAWSPDGGRIAFESDRDGNLDVHVMNADGSRPINLSRHPGADGDPAWSPGGSRLAFHTDREGNLEIYAMLADGSAPTNLSANPAFDGSPAWASAPPDAAPLAIIADLAAAVGALVTAGVLRPQHANGLTAKLNAAARHVGRGRDRTAATTLSAFIRQVEALLRARRVAPEPGRVLVGSAELAVASL